MPCLAVGRRKSFNSLRVERNPSPQRLQYASLLVSPSKNHGDYLGIGIVAQTTAGKQPDLVT